MLECKVDYLAISGRDDHAIAIFFWDDQVENKEECAVHVAFDANVFKESTFHQIADILELSINTCLGRIATKEKSNEKEKE